MLELWLTIIIAISTVLILVVFLIIKTNKNNKIKNKLFYNVDEIDNNLSKIDSIKYDVLEETLGIYQDDVWKDWPETELYEKNGSWKIFPFFAFNTWVPENCEKCPMIFNFIKNIKGLKLATLSKLSPGMKLKPHKGWGNHSNYVIRCHYGIIVPENCYVFVKNNEFEKIKYHEQFKWLIFDDSKVHYAENKSTDDRIVLILDVERPDNIKRGSSKVGDSKELIEIVNYFRQRNNKIDK